MSTGNREKEATEFVGDTNTEEVAETNPPDLKKKYLSYIFSVDFIIIVLIGQFLSLCITASIVTSGKLAEYGANFPTFQTFLTYIALFLIYTPITIYKKGFNGWLNILKIGWWKYLILSIFDVEGNYFVVKAYTYTSVLSIMLLDTWTTPCVFILLIIFLKVRFHWSQYLAVLICLGGVGILIAGDFENGKKEDMDKAQNLILGDIFCIISATCYAFSNVLEEYLVRRRPLYEVVGQMGFFGTIISGIQLSILERKELSELVWNGPIVGFLLVYTFVMFCLYTVAPVLFRKASSAFFNLSLLTSDFYTLVFAIYLFNETLNRFYWLAYFGTLIGLAVYNIYPATKPRVTEDKDNEDETRERERDVEAN